MTYEEWEKEENMVLDWIWYRRGVCKLIGLDFGFALLCSSELNCGTRGVVEPGNRVSWSGRKHLLTLNRNSVLISFKTNFFLEFQTSKGGPCYFSRNIVWEHFKSKPSIFSTFTAGTCALHLFVEALKLTFFPGDVWSVPVPWGVFHEHGMMMKYVHRPWSIKTPRLTQFKYDRARFTYGFGWP